MFLQTQNAKNSNKGFLLLGENSPKILFLSEGFPQPSQPFQQMPCHTSDNIGQLYCTALLSHTLRNYTKNELIESGSCCLAKHRINTELWCHRVYFLLDDLDINILQLCLDEIYIVFGVSEIISFGFRQGHSVLKLSFSRTSSCHRTFPPVSATISGKKAQADSNLMASRCCLRRLIRSSS